MSKKVNNQVVPEAKEPEEKDTITMTDEETGETTVVEVTTEEKPSFWKKHWKKFAIGGAVVGIAGIALVVRKVLSDADDKFQEDYVAALKEYADTIGVQDSDLNVGALTETTQEVLETLET